MLILLYSLLVPLLGLLLVGVVHDGLLLIRALFDVGLDAIHSPLLHGDGLLLRLDGTSCDGEPRVRGKNVDVQIGLHAFAVRRGLFPSS